jgi:hypothetical protein
LLQRAIALDEGRFSTNKRAIAQHRLACRWESASDGKLVMRWTELPGLPLPPSEPLVAGDHTYPPRYLRRSSMSSRVLARSTVRSCVATLVCALASTFVTTTFAAALVHGLVERDSAFTTPAGA